MPLEALLTPDNLTYSASDGIGGGTGYNFIYIFFSPCSLSWPDRFTLTEYCRSVTIVTKTKTTFFTQKIDQFYPKTGQFRHFFEVKNVVNFSNSSQQYSVNGKAKAKPLLYL